MTKSEGVLLSGFTGAGLIASARRMSLVALVVSCAAAGCKDEDIFEACTRLCQERITCAEERKLTPPTQTGCETACIGTRGNYFVELALEDCKDKTSCEFEKCVNPDDYY